MKNITTKKLVLTALFMALTVVATMFIRVPLLLGYVNLGDAFGFYFRARLWNDSGRRRFGACRPIRIYNLCARDFSYQNGNGDSCLSFV